MNRIKPALFAALVVVSTVSMSAERGSDTNRDQRMDAALQNYRNSSPQERAGGPVERSTQAVKRGAHKAKNAAERAAHKTGEAVRRTGKKMRDATEPKN